MRANNGKDMLLKKKLIDIYTYCYYEQREREESIYTDKKNLEIPVSFVVFKSSAFTGRKK